MHPAPPVVAGISDWRPLARGGFATVWEARQETLDRPVAVKVDERTLDSESERRRFLGEARAAGGLSGHPGIVTVHDAGILDDGRPYLVMKLCPGGSLTRWLRGDNRHTVEEICQVGIRIADALAAAHAAGMLHRDVKPANILIDSYGHAGLADFGLAAATEPGSAVGMTLAYAPPEAIRGQPPSEFGDVYQLAATMYALLSGHPPRDPIGGRTSLEDLVQRLDDPVESIPGVDDKLMQVLLDGLSPVPTDRPTAAAFRDQLQSVALTSAGSDAEPLPPRRGPEVRRRPHRVALILAAVTVLTLLVVVVAGSGVYLYEVDRSVTANIRRGIELPQDGPGEAKRPVKDPEADRTLDYVLIGTDEGDPALDQEGPSDSIMLVHLNQDRDEAYIISIPPETPVRIPKVGKSPIGKASAMRDPAMMVRILENVLQVRMDHVVMIDFPGFVNLTEDLDGVVVKNEVAFRSDGRYYPAGDITLKGEDALTYVREDDGLPKGQRAENQRNVLKAILSKGLSADVVADPLLFTHFIGNAAKRIQVDNALTDSELRSTALSLRLKASEIKLLSAPSGTPAQLEELGNALRKDTMTDYVKNHPTG